MRVYSRRIVASLSVLRAAYGTSWPHAGQWATFNCMATPPWGRGTLRVSIQPDDDLAIVIASRPLDTAEESRCSVIAASNATASRLDVRGSRVLMTDRDGNELRPGDAVTCFGEADDWPIPGTVLRYVADNEYIVQFDPHEPPEFGESIARERMLQQDLVWARAHPDSDEARWLLNEGGIEEIRRVDHQAPLLIEERLLQKRTT